MPPRVRFAPSPPGNVHIGNLRAAIFNWLFARHEGGRFFLRIEDTDRERSTPAAIENLLRALEWIGIDYDGEPVYQSRNLARHQEVAAELIEKGYAVKDEAGPTMLHLGSELFAPGFVSEPRDEVEIDVSQCTLKEDRNNIYRYETSKSGKEFVTPIRWDALASLEFVMADGSVRSGKGIITEVNEKSIIEPSTRGISKLRFKRRYVFFEDLVLGRLEKPLDSLRDLIIARADGSPVFHLANVVDDHDLGVTHILRGNDHVDNTYRHLFIYQALGWDPPRYGHFPMIVNAKGKPYSKRDGDAYVGDFRDQGFLPECLFNFLALCGWSPGDDREIMSRREMVDAFALENVKATPAQFNLEKLEWMNGQYLTRKPMAELLPLIRAELEAAGIQAGEIDPAWLERLIALQQEHLRTIKEFVANTHYFFSGTVTLNEKAVQKVLLKNDGAGLKVLRDLREVFVALEDWTEASLEKAILGYTEEKGLKLGQVAQPLRVALTGGTVSRGIWETVALIGRGRTQARLSRVLNELDG